MPNTLRSRPLALAALLLLLAAVSVDLCRHGVEIPSGAAARAVVSGGDCGEGCDPAAGSDDESHCHACLCACHALGVLTPAGGERLASAAGSLVAAPVARHAAGFRSTPEQPPQSA